MSFLLDKGSLIRKSGDGGCWFEKKEKAALTFEGRAKLLLIVDFSFPLQQP